MLSAALYLVLTSAMFGLTAWAVEALLALFGRPQRVAWMVSLAMSVVAPLGMMELAQSSDSLTSRQVIEIPMGWTEKASASVESLPASATASARVSLPPDAAGHAAVESGTTARSVSLDDVVLGAWWVSSTLTLAWVAFTGWLLNRRARTWPTARIDDTEVTISDMGPAVMGVLRPRIIVPRAVMSLCPAALRPVLAHEREHMKARDALVLFFGTLFVAAMPWNPVLWWQRRRLRFAIEKDCDQRVVASGLEPVEYARALLAMGLVQGVSPFGSVAVVERKPQLERRIRVLMSGRRQHRWVWGLAASLLAACGLALASELKVPTFNGPDSLLWLPPQDRNSFRTKAEAVAREKYPDLFAGKFEGTVLISVDLAIDGTVWGTSTHSFPPGIMSWDQDPARWSRLPREINETPGGGPVGTEHFVGWFGPTHQNGLYLWYEVYRWPADATRSPIRAQDLVAARHPGFFGCRAEAQEPTDWTNLTVIFNDDGTIAKEEQKVIPAADAEQVKGKKGYEGFVNADAHFEKLGTDLSTLAHWGRTSNNGLPPNKNCYITGNLYYAWLRRASDPVIDRDQERRVLEPIRAESLAHSDTSVLQQRLFERYFPSIWQAKVVSPKTGVWMVLSRTGKVVDHGIGTDDGLGFTLVQHARAAKYPGLLAPSLMSSVRTQKGQAVDIGVSWVPEDAPVQ